MPRVLIVEDDADIVLTLRQVLEDVGYDVSSAKNGLEGLDHLHGLKNEPQPDLVLLDLMMPVTSGWEFLQAKQGDSSVRDIPVVVITAASSHEARIGSCACAMLLIHKPFDVDRLLLVVERALNLVKTEATSVE